ncbi:hypothetical protein HK104_001871 [Borealophlyctis nickersoniae]|nr:hypothetical protein HK104_001871 [Borealophlyctis nickersoniae]
MILTSLQVTSSIVRRQNAADEGSDDGYGELYDSLIQNALVGGTITSLIVCIGVFATFLWMRKAYPELVSRITFRLAMGVICADFFYSLFYLLTAFPPESTESTVTPYCSAVMYLTIISELASLFLTVCISLHLLLVFVVKRKNAHENWYFIGSVGLAVVIPIAALVKQRFGLNAGECWFRLPEDENGGQAIAWEWTSLYGWVVLSVLLSASGALAFWYIVGGVARRNRRDLSQNQSQTRASVPGAGNARKTEKLVQRAMLKTSLYCIVPFFAQVFCIDSDLEDYVTGKSLWWTYFLANLMTGLQGALQGLVFFLADPAVQQARNDIRLALVRTHHLRYLPQAHQPSSSTSSVLVTERPLTTPVTMNASNQICQQPCTLYEKCMRKVVEATLVRKGDAALFEKEKKGVQASSVPSTVRHETYTPKADAAVGNMC